MNESHSKPLDKTKTEQNKTKRHTVLPTCSRQLRGNLGAVPHDVLVSVLAKTVIAVIMHVIIIVVILQGIGCDPANVFKLQS